MSDTCTRRSFAASLPRNGWNARSKASFGKPAPWERTIRIAQSARDTVGVTRVGNHLKVRPLTVQFATIST